MSASRPGSQEGGSQGALQCFAWLTAAATFVLIFTGGLVTSTGSGLAVPDWPLSLGQWFPPMVGGVLYEHGHRMVAGTVALLILILALWVWRRERRRAPRWLAAAALVAVLLQAILGGVTVLLRLPVAVSVAHACLAQAFFCLCVVLAMCLGCAWNAPVCRKPDALRPSLRALSILCATVIFAQLVLGALMRHLGAGLAIPDFPLAFGRLLPPLWTAAIAVHYAHRIGALLAVTAALWLVARAEGHYAAEPLLCRPARLLSALLLAQICLGATTIWTARAAFPTTLHVSIGAALLATSVVLALRAWRLTESATSHAVTEVACVQGGAA
ncbi:MAG: COX15/CtaA family protein [Acidobacteriota bacterium]